jgi:hypothetical protein
LPPLTIDDGGLERGLGLIADALAECLVASREPAASAV